MLDKEHLSNTPQEGRDPDELLPGQRVFRADTGRIIIGEVVKLKQKEEGQNPPVPAVHIEIRRIVHMRPDGSRHEIKVEDPYIVSVNAKDRKRIHVISDR